MGDKGAKVINMNGQPAGTDGTLTKYNFVGTPPTMYEHMPEVGEYRTMTVTVECTASGHKKKADGSYPAATWAIREAAIGREVDPPSDVDPDQTTIDEAIDEIQNEENAEGSEDDGVVDPDAEPDAEETTNTAYDVFNDGQRSD
ncbi:hypothetical protein SEA_LILBEANIE_54 [Gordonia phage Lilbeanie]|uniref:Uncharacterized protein n=1 Tax=Gordonia phage Lilbeanie TaxID=2794947 RepID=A0A7T1NXR0_9CAUD|nr:hypothetical protein J1773_gp54 [Gordonia phage Lilbeanie]QPO17132.1 hypothetical protein SEA_LILBEANIE_54 [Gordonia phage Lilbeanie]